MRKLKLVTSLLLAAAMLIGLVPFHAAAETVISEVNVSGFQIPAVGETAGENIARMSIPANAGYTAANLKWQEKGAYSLAENEVFEAGKLYCLWIVFFTEDGYVFRTDPSEPEALINGSRDYVDENYYDPASTNVYSSGGAMEYHSIYFTPTGAVPEGTVLGEVDLTGVTAPEYGTTAGENLLSLTVPAGAGYTVGEAKWCYASTGVAMKDNESFALDREYSLRVEIHPAEGWCIDLNNMPVFKINGSAAAVDSVSPTDSTSVVFRSVGYETQIEAWRRISEARIEGFRPAVAGASVSENIASVYVPDGAHYEIAEIEWWAPGSKRHLTTGAFPYDEQMSLVVTLSPHDGYVFASSTAALVNGGTDLVSSGGTGLNSYAGTFDIWTAFASASTIASVYIADLTGYERPTVGGTAGANLASVGVSSSAPYTVTDLYWYDVAGGARMAESAVFAEGREYRLCATLTADDMSTFTGETTATVNGSEDLVDLSSCAYSPIAGTFFFRTNGIAPIPAIPAVRVTGYRLPTAGETAGAAYAGISIPAGALYTIGEMYWYNHSDGVKMGISGAFQAGKQYSLTVRFNPASGKIFNDSTEATINGGTAYVDAGATGWTHNGGSFTLQTVRVTPEVSGEITAVEVTAALPVIGLTPADLAAPAVPDGAHYAIATAEWYNETDGYARVGNNVAFEENKQYYLYVTLTPDSGYAFSSAPAAFFNGDVDLVDTAYCKVRQQDGLYVFYTLSVEPSELVPEEIAAIGVTVEEFPALGLSPDDLAAPTVPDGAHYRITAWYWLDVEAGQTLPVASLFEAGKTYRLYVTLEPLTGYVFAVDPVLTVNGDASLAYPIHAIETTGGFFRTVDFEPEAEPQGQSVSVINILGYHHPVIGCTAGEALACLSVPEGASYAISTAKTRWVTANGILDPDTVFEEGKIYYLELWIAPNSGVTFSAAPTVFFDGSTVFVDSEYTRVNQYGLVQAYSKDHDSVEPEVIAIAGICGFTVPEPGVTATENLASVSLPEGAHYTLSEPEWIDFTAGEDMAPFAPFVAGRTYCVRFDLKPAYGYAFSNETVAAINGSEEPVDAEYTEVDEGVLVFFTKNYALTASPVIAGRTLIYDSAFSVRYLVPFDSYNALIAGGKTVSSFTLTAKGITTDVSGIFAARQIITLDGVQYFWVKAEGIAPKEIGTPITLALIFDDNGELMTDVFTDSVAAALSQVASDKAGTAFADAANATLAYCKAAADHFCVANSIAFTPVANVSPAPIAENSSGSGLIELCGTSILLKEELAIKFWAKIDRSYTGDLADLILKINGEAVEAVKAENGNFWTFKVSVPISEAKNAMTAQLFANGASVSNQYTDSVLNYAISLTSRNAPLGQAIVNFIHYANVYFGTLAAPTPAEEELPGVIRGN